MHSQSIKSNDRELGDWYIKINAGEIKLPRFQRFEAWDKKRISGFLTVIANNLPVGITLILNVNEPLFQDRYLETAPATRTRVLEHLLDGQQRLTAFWRMLHNNYPMETYYVCVSSLDKTSTENIDEGIYGYCQTRWQKGDRRYPLWADEPAELLKRGFIPSHLLRPVDMNAEIAQWIKVALEGLHPEEEDPLAYKKLIYYNEQKEKLTKIISDLRETVKHYNLPFLALPATTAKHVALDVFIKMNTNSKPLSVYDIIVAEVESVRGESLHALAKQIDEQYPVIKKYDDVGTLILSVAALLQDKIPNERGQMEMDKAIMLEKWIIIKQGLNEMALFLQSQGIFDARRLPSNSVLSVIAALYAVIPEKLDRRGADEIILKQYLWHSFFSNRYENSTNSRALQDYKHLKLMLTQQLKEAGMPWKLEDVPIFNGDHPLVSVEELMNTKWPKGENVKGRAVLAVATLLGACDFADGTKISKENLSKREYHHIFPNALLTAAGINPHLAINCALITDGTNRNIGYKDPLTYLKERYNWSKPEIIQQRLRTHLIPLEELSTGDYGDLADPDVRAKVAADFEKFKFKRALLLEEAALKLSAGNTIEAQEIFDAVDRKMAKKEQFHQQLRERLEYIREHPEEYGPDYIEEEI
jgi:hypothetical protein